MSDGYGRRRFLQRAGLAGTAGTVGLAGCLDILGGNDGSGGRDQDAYNPITPGGERELAGVPISEMPELSGTLDIYSGRGEPLVGALIAYLERQYPDLDLNVRYGSSIGLANKILNEGQNTPADIFFTVDAGALGLLKRRERTTALPDRVLSLSREKFRDPDRQWTGTSGRVRSIPFNTNEFSESDIPDDVTAFPNDDRFENAMGWAPSYGPFQSFVTAMRILRGPEETKQWLQGMLDAGVQRYSDEFQIAQAVADGEIAAGFANHYYTIRVQEARPDAPIALSFTRNDAGVTFNVAGALVTDTSDRPEMAATFVQHLLSAEAQNYFALSRTFEYPVIPELHPIEQLPTLDELETADVDLTQLADIEQSLELMREVGISV